MKVVVILPTYNERENILVLLGGLLAASQKIDHDVQYLIVDDSSPDGTADIVREFQKKHKEVHIIIGKKEGLGRALLRGMQYAKEELEADIIVQMDADLSHDPANLPDFIHAIDHKADFVVGSRYIPGGSIPKDWGFDRKLFSILGNAIVRLGLGHLNVKDWTGGYRAYKSNYYDLFKKEMTEYTGYVFQIAFLHKSLTAGAKIEEVPIHFTDRLRGKSKIAKGEYITNVLWFVAKTRIEECMQGTVGKFAVVGGIGFIINTIALVGLVRFGLAPWMGSAIGAELAIISNFILNNSWTFQARKVSGKGLLPKFIQFNATSLGALAIQTGTVWLGTYLLGNGVYIYLYVGGVLLGMIWNYTMYSKVIWKK